MGGEYRAGGEQDLLAASHPKMRAVYLRTGRIKSYHRADPQRAAYRGMETIKSI